MKNKIFRITALILIISAIAILISARSCTRRSSKTKTGSSNNNTFSINAPSSLTATVISPYQINISWQDNSNNEDGFEVEQSLTGNTYTLISTLNTDMVSYSDTDLTPFSVYYYRVRAFNTLGDVSAWSNVISASTGSVINWSSLAVGESYTIALTSDGIIWSWGSNGAGQLGLGDASPITVTTPAQLWDDGNWSMVVAGYYHTVGIKNDATIWGWGANESGQLGLGDFDIRTEPTQVTAETDWSFTAGGANHTLALKDNGTIWSWGYNSYGQLGLGYSGDPYDPENLFNYVNTPTQIGTGSDWSVVTAGSAHSLAIKTNKTIWSWGFNETAQLGLGDYNTRTNPTQIGTTSDWSMASGSYFRTVALKTNGTRWGWGELGSITPIQIGTDTDWLYIDAGGTDETLSYTVGIKTNFTVWAWGDNTYGQLGLGDTTFRGDPTQIVTLSGCNALSVGGYHSIALTGGNTAYVWGVNNYYQLGLGDTEDRNIPTLVGD